MTRSLALAVPFLFAVGCAPDAPSDPADGGARADAGPRRDAEAAADAGLEDAGLEDAGVPPTCGEPTSGHALDFLGTFNGSHGLGDGVSMGVAPALGLATFTLEAWIRWDGYGTSTGSGVGGVVGEPIVGKGRGESDGSRVDCNYLFVVDADGKLAADFEDMASGANHPIRGEATIRIGAWTHVAATFDGREWCLYVDGALDARREVATGAVPRHDSIQHFGIGAAYNSMGVPAGGFDGLIDDVRVWDRALSQEELRAGMFERSPGPLGLVAHFPLSEGSGSTVTDRVAGLEGQVTGARWQAVGRPHRASAVPTVEPSLASPSGSEVRFDVETTDADGDAVIVEVFARRRLEAEPFTIVVLPDTQVYVRDDWNHFPQLFYDQTRWTADNAATRNIRAVFHLGDIVNQAGGVNRVLEWERADRAMSTLERPLEGHPDGVPYGIAVGNHDQDCNTNTDTDTRSQCPTTRFNQWFGVERFEGRAYYGGHEGTRNDDSYILFEAGELKFLAFFFNWDLPHSKPHVLAWARRLVRDHSDRMVFASMHSCLLGTWTTDDAGPSGRSFTQTPFSTQGDPTYRALRGEPGLRMMFGGHTPIHGRRTDVAASTVHSLLQDYQFDRDPSSPYALASQNHRTGGDGKMRILTFSPRGNQVRVETYSPSRDMHWREGHYEHTLELDLDRGGGAFVRIGVARVEAGATAELTWSGVEPGTYDWYARATDCTHTVESPRQSFVVGD